MKTSSAKNQRQELAAQKLIMQLIADADIKAIPRDIMARNLLSGAIGCIIGQFGIETARIMTSNFIEQIAEHQSDNDTATRRH